MCVGTGAAGGRQKGRPTVDVIVQTMPNSANHAEPFDVVQGTDRNRRLMAAATQGFEDRRVQDRR